MSYARLCPARRRTRIRLPKHRAPIRQAPVENGLPRAVQTVFRFTVSVLHLLLSRRLLMPVLHRVSPF